jgi:predicted homoserine dehydrogenase-like protein
MYTGNKGVPHISIIGLGESDTGQAGGTTVNQIYRSGNAVITSIFENDQNHLKKLIFYPDKKSVLFSGDIAELEKDRDSRIVIIIDMDVDYACEAIIRAISLGKNVINLNSEVEILFGIGFQRIAADADVIYTFGAGDEPQTALELVQFARQLGFQVVAAGKGKNNPLNRSCVPDDFIDVSRRTGVSPKSYTSFVDGTKTMIEMSLLANMTGMTIDKPGMHGPKCDKSQMTDIFRLQSEGGILNQEGVVDYTIGDLAPGVFVVIKSDDEAVVKDLYYLKVGSGSTFMLYRPFHLGIMETMKCVFHVNDFNQPLVKYPGGKMVDVAAVAKQNISAGTPLHGIGTELFYGHAVVDEEMREGNYVPITLLNRAVAVRNIPAGEIVKLSDIKLDENSLTCKLWNFFDNIYSKFGIKRLHDLI